MTDLRPDPLDGTGAAAADANRPGWPQFAVLAALTALLLLVPAWRADYLNFDDNRLAVPGGELDQAGWATAIDPSQTIAEAYLPVSHLSLLVDLRLLGGGSRVAHLHGLLLHLLAAFVLARFGARLGLARWPATLAAALFLVHPALCESVLWVSGRKDVLSGLFTFLALGELAGRGRPSRTGLWTALACYAKGTAIVLAPLALALAWWRRRRGLAPARGGVLAAALVSIGAAVHHATLAARAGTMTAPLGPDTGLLDRLLQVPGALAHYVTTSIWPSGLNVLYPEVATLEGFVAAWLPSTLVLLALLAAIVVSARRRSADWQRTALGLSMGLLALLPFNTALPATSLAAADRYLYLAIPGFALALLSLPRVGPPLGAVALLPLALVCFGRAPAFRDNEALWQTSLASDPDNAVAIYNLAIDRNLRRAAGPEELAAQFDRAWQVARLPQHRYQAAAALREVYTEYDDPPAAMRAAVHAADALEQLPPALRDRPAERALRVQTHLAAARLARRADRADLAEQQLAAARALDPGAPLLLCFEADRLRAELREERVAAGAGVPSPAALEDPRARQASELLERALAAAPQLYDAYWVRAELALLGGRFLKAKRDLETAIAIDPRRPEAHVSTVDMWLARRGPGMHAAAEKAARVALELGVRDPGLRFRLAAALFQQGDIDAAREHYESYLQVRPDDVDARIGLATVLAAVGYQQLNTLPPEELGQLAERIAELDPLNTRGVLMKAVVARQQQRLQEALVLLDRLCAEMPQDAEIRLLRAETVRDLGWQRKLEGGRDGVAFDLFRRFLDLAEPGLPTEAVQNTLRSRCRVLLREGQQALLDGDLDTAEQRLRRCLELQPGDTGPYLQLGMTLMQREADRREALECFEKAAAGNRARGIDPSLAILYQAKVLAVLGEREVGRARLQAFLDELPDGADADTVARMREWLDR